MKLSGTATLPAPPEKVWAAINDPVILAKCLPGCERLDPDGPDRFKAAVSFGLAAISGKYAGSLELADRKPPHSMRLKMDGKGIPGFVKGEGRIELKGRGKHTELHYEGEAQVGGMIAAVGQRMIEAASKKIVAQFFEKFSAEIAAKP
ncbi:MAG TPA: carbon monoxide dehydrogenase subunit G [Candidatus Acidoferrum sp.]|nr:carbon monoxide dehydrogenase subunit G [Candidatus Acidoferrum sp.]